MKKTKSFILIFLLFLLFFAFRLPSLGRDISNSDAARWHRRTESFLRAVKTGDLKSTYQNYQPGVILMWLEAPVEQILFSLQYYKGNNVKTLENFDWYPVLHGISKLVLVLTLSLLFAYQLWLISKLSDFNTSLIFGLFLSCEPFVAGVDRYFHLSSLETYLSFAAFLSILYWRKVRADKFLYISAAAFAFSVLTKTSTLISLPVYIYIFLQDKAWVKNSAKFAALSLAVFIFLFPAIWAAPAITIHKLVYGIFNAVNDDVRTNIYKGIFSFLYYPLVLGFKLNPVTFFLSVLILVKIRELWKNPVSKATLLYFALFYLAFSLSVKKIDRYSISLIFPLLLLAAVFLSLVSKRFKQTILALYILSSSVIFFAYTPVFSSYYSPVFGGLKGALASGIYDNSGEYFAQAAFYLNTKGRNKYVYLPHNRETFFYYYSGKESLSGNKPLDYEVLSVNRISSRLSVCDKTEKVFGSKIDRQVFVFSCR